MTKLKESKRVAGGTYQIYTLAYIVRPSNSILRTFVFIHNGGIQGHEASPSTTRSLWWRSTLLMPFRSSSATATIPPLVSIPNLSPPLLLLPLSDIAFYRIRIPDRSRLPKASAPSLMRFEGCSGEAPAHTAGIEGGGDDPGAPWIRIDISRSHSTRAEP